MMKELETLQRAKRYMEDLAKGINPLDGTKVPDHEVVNNVRLSRCFFYVAGVLQEVIDEKTAVPEPKPSKTYRQPFDLNTVDPTRVELSEEPIPVSELAKRISAGIDESGMRKLSFNVITKWLLEIGVLEEFPIGENRTGKRPTARGRELGLLTQQREGVEGPYLQVLYSRNAQQFILDNLDALQPYMRQPRVNKGLPWDREQDRQLAELWENGLTSDSIAREMGRSGMAIRARLQKLGLMK